MLLPKETVYVSWSNLAGARVVVVNCAVLLMKRLIELVSRDSVQWCVERAVNPEYTSCDMDAYPGIVPIW